ncbi:MAG: S-layer protein [Candidatus Bilamarchaeaceae archaeon]
MKVNLKKIGAIVAGATILATSVAFAGLMYKDTELLSQNGQPLVKVVVGEKAAASDGVAAANIAAKVANEAYVKQTLTASWQGTPACADGASTGGAATVTNEKVTLEITVPGTVAEGTAVVTPLVGETINRQLLDRDVSGTQTYALNVPDTTDNANPFYNDGSNALGGMDSYTALYRIDGSAFAPFATQSLTDTNSGKNYKEYQNAWIKGYTNFFDTTLSVDAKLNIFTYSVKFAGASDDYGIPICTTPSNSTNYEICGNDYKTSTHKVAVKFLGEDWIISEMSGTSTQETSLESKVVKGGYVKLAKESASGVLDQGQCLDLGNVKVCLDDIVEYTHEAAISIQDANGNVLQRDKVTEATTKEITAGGTKYRIHVYKTTPGFTFGSKWADMAVFSHELKVESGSKLDPDYDDNKEWKVLVGWKNRGAGQSGDDGYPDHLRTIILYTTDGEKILNPTSQYMVEGDSVSIVTKPAQWKLTYNGLDITDDQRDTLQFTLYRENSGTKTFKTGSSEAYKFNVTTPYMMVSSGRGTNNAFRFTGYYNDLGSTQEGTDDSFYISLAQTPYGASPIAAGAAWIKYDKSNDYYVMMNYTGAANAGGSNVSYSTAGDGVETWAGGGMIKWQNRTDLNSSSSNSTQVVPTQYDYMARPASGSLPDWYFGISEKAGTGVSYNSNDLMVFGLYLSGTSSSFNIDYQPGTVTGGEGVDSGIRQGKTNASTYVLKKDYIRYYSTPMLSSTATSYYANGTYKEGFISERGSVFNSIDDTAVTFSIAKQLAHAQFTLSSAGSTSSATATTKILGEGESTVVNGVTVKVKEITETATCAAGGAAASCTLDEATVQPVITGKGEPASSVESESVYKLTNNMVVLDNAATGLDTGVVVTVGGPSVNSVSKSALANSGVDFTATPVVVTSVGNKIVVAGFTADDTMTAAEQFLSELKRTN